MVTSSILNIAITLVFIYLVLAIMITGLNEMIFTFTRKRAQYLERAIDHLFFDGEWKEIAGKVKDSPFINSLKKARNIFPAYIPASNFAKAVLTSFGTGSYSVEAIREYLASTPPKGEFSRMMAALVQKEDLKIEELEQEIEELYNNSMDRLSAWFKRNAKILSFSFALLIAFLLNIDTINITTQLWKNKGKSEQIADFIATAQQSFQKGDSGHIYLNYAGDTLARVVRKASGGNLMRSMPEPGDSAGPKAAVQSPVQTITGSYDILTDLGIPMGWTRNNIPSSKEGLGMAVILWLIKMIGILLTAFATSLGAPFWFDLLNKVTPLRQALKTDKK